MRKQSQNRSILAALRRGREITPAQALREFRCARLAARICDLRDEGHDIISRPVKTRSGARVASYRLGR